MLLSQWHLLEIRAYFYKPMPFKQILTFCVFGDSFFGIRRRDLSNLIWMNNLILDWFSESHVRTFKRKTKNQEGLKFYDCGRASDNANHLQPSRASPGAAVEAGMTLCLGSWPEEEARGKLHANRTRVTEVPWYHWGDQDVFVRVEVQSKYVWNLKAQKSKNIVLNFV